MLNKLKRNLAAVFDDNLRTRQWHNVVDYIIIGMILLSTAEIFLSTFNVAPTLRRILLWVDIVTLVFFTIEVTLRIWVAPLSDPKYSGWKGRLRYCFSFHGFLDWVSTFPYYLQWVFPIPLGWIKVLRVSRVTRLFRLSRYTKSWRLLTDSIREKRRELFISMQFLLLITLALSLVLFFCEHEAQPDEYANAGSTVAWAFAQYIGDPGGFGDTPPVTLAGRIIACIVGLLGIAIVAVPAGILGAGFTEAIEKESRREELEENHEKLRLCFERKQDRPTHYQIVPPFRSVIEIQARQNMTADEIIEAVGESDGYRMVNLAGTIPIDKNPVDRLAVEHFHHNRSYGQMIDRGSRITIIGPSSYIDPCSGFFPYYLAKIGGFNYISREFGAMAPAKSYFNMHEETLQNDPRAAEFLADLQTLTSRRDAWSLCFLVSSGAADPEHPEQIHFGTGGSRGDETIGPLVTDKETCAKFFADVEQTMEQHFGVATDTGKYYTTAGANIVMRRLAPGAGHIVMRMAWALCLWDSRRMAIAQALALCINRNLAGFDENPADPDLKTKAIGF